jgi:aldehyde dehydrogenase (NAD+)
MNQFQKIFDAQKALFATGVTRSYGWRVDQLDRMARMIRENEARFQQAMAKEFKTASQEYIFETAASAGESEVQKSQLKEWMKPVEAPVPQFLAKTGHKGMIYREPYGVALIIGPFNGPLLLLIRPALAALAAGNTCILTLSEALPETTKVLLDLVPKYFDPSAVTMVAGGKEQNTELLKHLCREDRCAGGSEKPHAGSARTRRDEPGDRRRDREHSRCGEEDRLGCDGLGRPMVHLAGLRLCP